MVKLKQKPTINAQPQAEGGQLSMVPLAHIAPHPKNSRINEQDPKFTELVQSVQAVGVLVPLLVRPVDFYFIDAGKHGRKEGFFVLDRRITVEGSLAGAQFYRSREEAEAARPRYELMAGERRMRAARAAGLGTAPVIIRELDDRQALEVMITENMQREDLGPIEQARAISTLIEIGYSVETAADKLGKSMSWVARRSRLTELIPQWSEAFAGCCSIHEGNGVQLNVDLSTWSVRGMEIIARLPQETQQAIWDEKVAGADQWDLRQLPNMSAEDVDSMAERYMRELRRAPWGQARPMGELPACKGCLRRSQAQPELFDIEGPKDDHCLDPDCWTKKEKLHAEALIKKAETEHGEVLRLSQSYSTKTPGVIGYDRWNRSEKGKPGARPGVIVEGGKPEMVWVTMSRGEVNEEGKHELTVEMKKVQHDLGRRRILIELICEEIPCGIGRQLDNKGERGFTELLGVALVLGLEHWSNSSWYWTSEWEQIEAKFIQPTIEVREAFGQQIGNVFIKRLKRDMYEPNMGEAFKVCQLLGIDIHGLYETACERKPYPKSWAAEAEKIETPTLESFIKESRRHDYGNCGEDDFETAGDDGMDEADLDDEDFGDEDEA
jgi:ParB family chromosome partitioning protein